MIRLLSGVTRKGSRLVYPSDGPFELTAKEEKHLVETGSAEYVTEAPGTDVATAPVGPDAQEAGANLPATVSVPEGQETPHSVCPAASPAPHDEGKNQAGVPEGSEDDTMDLPDCVVVIDGHMTVESLLKMTKNDLLSLAADMDLKVNDKMSKSTIAALISDVEVGYDEDAILPDLSQEDPAV